MMSKICENWQFDSVVTPENQIDNWDEKPEI